jgi:hypothetical protein
LLSIYPWAELTYCAANKPEPVGQTLRPGSIDVGWIAFHQWLANQSRWRAREFAATIHGEINPEVGEYLLNHQAGEVGN